MPLDTLANLKIEVLDWAHRSIPDARLDTFIDLAETEMLQNPVQILKVTSGDTRAIASLSITSRFLALPDGFREMRRLRLDLDTGFSQLKFRIPAQLRSIDGPQQPCFFTITSQIEFDTVPDEAYTAEMTYFADFVPLSSNNTSNPVLTNNPHIYLWGVLKQFYAWAEDPEQEAKYEIKFINAIRGANKKDRIGRYGPGPQMKVVR